MKYFIVFAIALTAFNAVNSMEYTEDDNDSYDDEPIEERATSAEDDYEKPMYDIKDAQALFLKFISDFSKHYKDEDAFNKGFGFFRKNLAEIIENNKKGGSVSDINSFADYSDEQLAKLTG